MTSRNDWYESIPCALCGAREYRVRYRPERELDDPMEAISASHGVMGTQQVVDCAGCGLVYVNPRLRPEVVLRAYQDSVDPEYVSQAEERLRTFRGGVRVLDAALPSRGRVLDVGAAAGFFVKEACNAGWEASGLEPSRWLAEWGRSHLGVDLREGTLDRPPFPEQSFDAITMWDTLEHTADPPVEMRAARRLLRPGGILLVNYPDIGSWLARAAGRHWWYLLSVHLYYFTSQTMARLLRQTGFRPLSFHRHIQTLSLGYLAEMGRLYSPPLSRTVGRAVRALGLGQVPISYYAAQTNVIAVREDS